jgi:hypothetical protein
MYGVSDLKGFVFFIIVLMVFVLALLCKITPLEMGVIQITSDQ